MKKRKSIQPKIIRPETVLSSPSVMIVKIKTFTKNGIIAFIINKNVYECENGEIFNHYKEGLFKLESWTKIECCFSLNEVFKKIEIYEDHQKKINKVLNTYETKKTKIVSSSNQLEEILSIETDVHGFIKKDFYNFRAGTHIEVVYEDINNKRKKINLPIFIIPKTSVNFGQIRHSHHIYGAKSRRTTRYNR